MPRKADPAKQIAKLQSETKTLKAQLQTTKKALKDSDNSLKSKLAEAIELAYNKGYEQARIDQTKLDDAFDKFMEKSARQFEKEYLAKIKKTKKAKNSKKAPAAKAASKPAAAKRRGRPSSKVA